MSYSNEIGVVPLEPCVMLIFIILPSQTSDRIPAKNIKPSVNGLTLQCVSNVSSASVVTLAGTSSHCLAYGRHQVSGECLNKHCTEMLTR